MSKVAVVYWSGTGNTEEMANKVAEGAKAAGAEVEVISADDFDGTDIPIDMTGIESMNKLYELFLKHNYNEKLLEDIFFNNARNFLLRF